MTPEGNPGTAPRCQHHNTALDPQYRCSICRREREALERNRIDRRLRRYAKFAVGVAAGVTFFAWLLAAFDTKRPQAPRPDAGTAALEPAARSVNVVERPSSRGRGDRREDAGRVTP